MKRNALIVLRRTAIVSLLSFTSITASARNTGDAKAGAQKFKC